MRESKLWFWHIIAAAVILVFLGLHMVVMHLGAILGALGVASAEPTSPAAVFQRSRQVFYMITYIVLLGAALYHGLYGLRTILCELSPARGLQKTVNGVFTAAGLALFAYGSYVAVFVFLGVTQ